MLVETFETLFDKTFAHPLNGGHAGRDFFRDLLIAQPVIGFEQDSRSRCLASRRFSAAQQALQFVSFFCAQLYDVLFHRV
jgi:hypothetical protein